MRSGVLTGNNTGGAAQVAAAQFIIIIIARMNGLWTPQSAAITDPHYAPASRTMAFTRNVLRQ